MKHEGYVGNQQVIIGVDEYESQNKTTITANNTIGIGTNPAQSTGSASYNYKYNGKELQEELGLNMYAMDMRQYDPAIARWVVQDPVVHHSMSPYNAFDNNPVFWADPSGADANSSTDLFGRDRYDKNGMFIPPNERDSNDSTGVRKNDDGTYSVVGAENDGDTGIYMADENNKWNKKSKKIGNTLNPWDFLFTDDETGEFSFKEGLIFNPNSKLNFATLLYTNKFNLTGDTLGDLILLAMTSANKSHRDLKYFLGAYTTVVVNSESKIYTTVRTTSNVSFGLNLRKIQSASNLSTRDFYVKYMPFVGRYNQHQNEGNGYNKGYPFFGEHTYSGTGIYNGYYLRGNYKKYINP